MDRIGRYEVVRVLGHGGMGAVYLGRDPELRRSVALKLLHRENADFALKQEARVLAALNHPGIVTIFEIGEHEERQFIAMEYLAGASLRSLLEDKRLSRGELVAICAKVALAVDAAHTAGILHRDIKPENVVVGDNGVVKVVDFGIARRLHGDTSMGGQAPTRPPTNVDAITRTLSFYHEGDTVLTAATKTIFGTPAYMAPEVLMGEPSTEASDVYSLGVMLYECLSGRRPYESPLLHEMIALVVDGSEPIPRLDDPVADLVERMLSRDAAARPSLREIAVALEAPRRTRRRLWPFAVAAVLALATTIGAWRITRSESATAPARPIALRPFEVQFENWGSNQPSGTAFADVVSLLLRDAGVNTIGPKQLYEELRTGPGFDRAAKQLGAGAFAEAKLVQRAGTIEAHLVLHDLTTRATRTFEHRVAGVDQLPALFDQLAADLARTQPHTRASSEPVVRARMFLDIGLRYKVERDWANARPYLEQAVAIDPTSAEAWHEVASVAGWSMAPQASIEHAIDRAHALAADGPHKQIWLGAQAFYKGEFSRAAEILEALPEPALRPEDVQERAYYLAEARWHDGDHDAAAALFRGILERDIKFKAAAIHLGEYAIARRRVDAAREMAAVLELKSTTAQFAARNYEELAARDDAFPDNLYSQLVLERPTTYEHMWPVSLNHSIYDVGRAIDRGDPAGARKLFAALWSTIENMQPTDGVLFNIEMLGELLLCAEMQDELRAVLAFVAKATTPRATRIRHRLSLLAAPALGPVTSRDGMIKRYRTLATAIDAELAGDRARAADVLRELVADPSYSWDFPERMALARNLRALGKTEELAALCDETAHPAVFRIAFMAARASCRRLLR